MQREWDGKCFSELLPYPYPPQGAFPVPFSLGKGVGPVPSSTPLPPLSLSRSFPLGFLSHRGTRPSTIEGRARFCFLFCILLRMGSAIGSLSPQTIRGIIFDSVGSGGSLGLRCV